METVVFTMTEMVLLREMWYFMTKLLPLILEIRTRPSMQVILTTRRPIMAIINMDKQKLLLVKLLELDLVAHIRTRLLQMRRFLAGLYTIIRSISKVPNQKYIS